MEIEELVVRARPDGLDETAQGFENMQGELDAAADKLESTGDDMNALANRWQGAVSAILGGLSIAAAGLLSRVPVIGTSMELLGDIIDGLAYQIDNDLRPSLNRTNDDLADTSSEVYEAESTLDAFQRAWRGVNNAIDEFFKYNIKQEIQQITGITIPDNWLDFGWDVFTLDAKGAFESIKRIAGNFKSDFLGFVRSLSPEAAAGWELIFDKADQIFSTGVDDIRSTLDGISNWFTSNISKGVVWGGRLISNFRSGIQDRISSTISLIETITNVFDRWIQDAYEWGRNLIEKFIAGIRSKIDDLRNLVSLDGGGNSLGGTVTTGIRETVEHAIQGSTSSRGFSANRTITNQLFIDGRQANQSISKYSANSTSRRGRFG